MSEPLRPLSPEDYIYLTNGAKYWVGAVCDIVSVEVTGNYSEFFLNTGQKLSVLGSLKKWEARLPQSIFFKAGRSCIINLKHIEIMEAHSAKQFSFTMLGDREVIMSTSQSLEFKRTRTL